MCGGAQVAAGVPLVSVRLCTAQPLCCIYSKAPNARWSGSPEPCPAAGRFGARAASTGGQGPTARGCVWIKVQRRSLPVPRRDGTVAGAGTPLPTSSRAHVTRTPPPGRRLGRAPSEVPSAPAPPAAHTQTHPAFAPPTPVLRPPPWLCWRGKLRQGAALFSGFPPSAHREIRRAASPPHTHTKQ